MIDKTKDMEPPVTDGLPSDSVQSEKATFGGSRAAAPDLTSRFEFDAIVKEFDTLRAEVITRIQKQQDITNFAIGLAAGFAAFH